LLAKKIGIDLGTSRVRIHVKGEGIVVDEPSIVAFDPGRARIVAYGKQAAEMAAKAPESVQVVRPLREGVITDLAATEALLRHFIDRVQGRQRIFKPEVMICIASGVGRVERRDLTEAAISAGARQAWLIDEALAAALGAGLEIAQLQGHAMCVVGAGTTEIAVIAESGTVVARSIPMGGDRMDAAIAAHLRREHNLLIEEHSAEQLKISTGAALPVSSPPVTVVDGLDASSRSAKSIRLNANEIAEAIGECLRPIADAVREVIEETPPKLAADVRQRGFVLTGGAAQLAGLDRYLSTQTGIPARLAAQPAISVVMGAGMALESFEVLKRDHSYVR
jgi:rod shape-determining protein MreB